MGSDGERSAPDWCARGHAGKCGEDEVAGLAYASCPAADADHRTGLGFEPARQDGASKLYRAADFGRMCHAMAQHLTTVALPA